MVHRRSAAVVGIGTRIAIMDVGFSVASTGQGIGLVALRQAIRHNCSVNSTARLTSASAGRVYDGDDAS
jgi:hypothetical protein